MKPFDYGSTNSEFTKRLRRRHSGFGDTYFLDEVFVKIGGKQHYLWRAVDQDGEVVDVYLQARRDANAAKRFFQRFLKAGGVPERSSRTNCGVMASHTEH